MTRSPCERGERIQRFVDGELDPDEAERVREHLAHCPRCEAELEEALQVAVLAQMAAEDREPQRAPGTSSRRRRRRQARTRRSVFLPAGATVVVLLIVLFWILRRPHSDDDSGVMAGPATRPVQVWMASLTPKEYRPYDVTRGSSSLPPSHAGVLARLEERQDWRGLAAMYVYDGDLRRAGVALQHADDSASSDSDRAAVAFLENQYPKALALADRALAQDAKDLRALWNRGLVLEKLQFPILAAESFEQVAARGPRGWNDEARAQAQRLRDEVKKRTGRWKEATDAGIAMIAGGIPAPALVEERPDAIRQFFYHALRAAPSAERARALLPVAVALDAHFGGRWLRGATERVIAANHSQRSKLADRYRQFQKDQKTLDGPARASFIDELRRAGADDLLFGALGLDKATVDHAAAMLAISRRSGDPWLLAQAALQRAQAARSDGHLLDAEALLWPALDECRAARLERPCSELRHELVNLYKDLNRPVEAGRLAMEGLDRAIAAGEAGKEVLFLQDLATVARIRPDLAVGRACVQEVARRGVEPCVDEFVHLQFAQLELESLHPEEARRELAAARSCNGRQPQSSTADLFAELARFSITDAEVERALGVLRESRAQLHADLGKRAIVDKTEGRLLIEREPERARSLLWQAIEEAKGVPSWNVDATKARSASYATLVDELGRSKRFEEALALIAKEINADVPSRCAVGAAQDLDRVLVIVRTAGGEVRGRYERRRDGVVDVPHLVEGELLRALDGCAEVDVFARPPLQGRAALLPPSIAWRYRTGPAKAASPRAAIERRLIVSDVDPPRSLELPSLASVGMAADEPGVVHLARASATPARVLEAIAGATWIELHTHGLVDAQVSDASFLVLTKGDDGRYALTARQVRETKLDGAPLVILGACRAAETAPWRHEAWSLPMAFIHAGARAVIASTTDLSDREAGPFFDDVRARIRAGASDAIALRDARVARLAGDPGSTVSSVLLFE